MSMSIPSLDQIERDFKARMERMSELRSRAHRAADDASRAVAMCKDRDMDGLCEVVQELSRIVIRLVEESA
jgi:hypothetical protein